MQHRALKRAKRHFRWVNIPSVPLISRGVSACDASTPAMQMPGVTDATAAKAHARLGRAHSQLKMVRSVERRMKGKMATGGGAYLRPPTSCSCLVHSTKRLCEAGRLR